MSTGQELEVIKEAVKAAHDFLSQIVIPVFNSPLVELAELATDKIRFWRFKTQVKILNKSKKIIEEAGILPSKISLKVLVPLLENGSLEEDEDMIDRWAALLANAVNPNFAGEVGVGYVDMLRQLAPKDALILDRLFEHYRQKFREGKRDGDAHFHPTLAEARVICGMEQVTWERSMSNLSRLGLVTTGGIPLERQSSDSLDKYTLVLTDYAFRFVMACKKVSDRRE